MYKSLAICKGSEEIKQGEEEGRVGYYLILI